MDLILLSNFMQILNIKRKHSTKNEHFSKHNQFTTLYLLWEQK
jgi:hypothetical protein